LGNFALFALAMAGWVLRTLTVAEIGELAETKILQARPRFFNQLFVFSKECPKKADRLS
jgi:hypothetical protein